MAEEVPPLVSDGAVAGLQVLLAASCLSREQGPGLAASLRRLKERGQVDKYEATVASLRALVASVEGLLHAVTDPDHMAKVVSSGDLMRVVLSFLTPSELETCVAVTCRLWKNFSRSEDLWMTHLCNMLPSQAAAQRHVPQGARALCKEYQRCVAERRWWCDENWEQGLLLTVEIWDARDNLRMLSVHGPLGVHVNDTVVSLLAVGAKRVEVVGPAFSAADRDPELRRLSSVQNYFRQVYEELPGPPAGELCLRATITDMRTGVMALLYEATRPALEWDDPHDNANPPPGAPGALPEGRDCFVAWGSDEFSNLISLEADLSTLDFCFHVCQEPSQQGIDPADQLWRLAGGDCDHYGEHPAFVSVRMTGSKGEVGRFIKGLLLGPQR